MSDASITRHTPNTTPRTPHAVSEQSVCSETPPDRSRSQAITRASSPPGRLRNHSLFSRSRKVAVAAHRSHSVHRTTSAAAARNEPWYIAENERASRQLMRRLGRAYSHGNQIPINEIQSPCSTNTHNSIARIESEPTSHTRSRTKRKSETPASHTNDQLVSIDCPVLKPPITIL